MTVFQPLGAGDAGLRLSAIAEPAAGAPDLERWAASGTGDTQSYVEMSQMRRGN